jgi:methylated-DNA-[protein]-cysteine S-methyltransferase
MPTSAGVCNHCNVSRFYALAATAEWASPVGPVRVAATAAGVAAVALQDPVEDFAAGLTRRGLVVDAERSGASARGLASRAANAIAAVLDGEAVDLDPFPVDIGDRPEWDRLVLAAVRAIPRGETVSYGEIARRIGRPGAAQAVGGAVGRNPVGLLVPCHRVIAADGTLGGYGVATFGGREAALDLKRSLLALEGVTIPH